MLQTIRNAWKVTDVRKKILFTVLILAVYRLGCAVPVPFLDSLQLKEAFSSSESLLGLINIFSGGSFSKATVFALSIQPYITASIVIQLLTIAIPALERISKEGEAGRKKIEKYTRYSSVALSILMAVGYYLLLKNQYGVCLLYTSRCV